MLEKMLESLPENLRNEFAQSVSSVYGPPKSWVIAAVALHLIRCGLSDISFRKPVILPDGVKAYVDVYCSSLNIYVLCITDPNLAWVNERAKTLRDIDTRGKIVVAIQEWLAWNVEGIEVDEILVVKMNGEVLQIAEWKEKRLKELEEAAINFVCELRSLQRYLSETLSNYEETRAARRGLCDYISTILMNTFYALGIEDASWLSQREYATEIDTMVNNLWKEAQLAMLEMLKKFVDFANKLMTTYTPYKLSITEKGLLMIERDPIAEQWHGYMGKPELESTHSAALKKELEIITRMLEDAERSGKTIPKKVYTQFHFLQQRGEWPPKTVVVPIKTLEELLQEIHAMKADLQKLGKLIK